MAVQGMYKIPTEASAVMILCATLVALLTKTMGELDMVLELGVVEDKLPKAFCLHCFKSTIPIESNRARLLPLRENYNLGKSNSNSNPGP